MASEQAAHTAPTLSPPTSSPVQMQERCESTPEPVRKHSFLGMYAVVGLLMTFCGIYTALMTFIPAPFGLLSDDCECTGGIKQCLCARETVEALNPFEIFCIANARVSAYMLYPLYIVMYLSMARNIRAYLQHTVIAEYVPLTSLHGLHVWAGTWIAIGITWHTIFHLIRWGVQNKLSLLVDHVTGVTGLIAIVITPVLVLPMRMQSLRDMISFEVRKRLHYLSWVWAAAVCLHAPQQQVFWIMGAPFIIYVIDWFYGVFVTTYMAPNARFIRLESSVMIRVYKPEGFDMKGAGGYCYLCVPWVAKYEWHAISTFKDPFDEDYVCFCIAVAGDWTKKLHDAVTEPVFRRIWLYGPFPSPFETASDNDNVISVASGIGITPALSVVQSLADTRKMHLIWIVRDASLLEFILDYGAKFDDDAYTLIFYTGKREPIFRRQFPYNIFLLRGRPDLGKLIPSLINATQNECIPNVEAYREVQSRNQDVEEAAPALEHQFYSEITRLLLSYTVDELFAAAVRRSHMTSRRVTFCGLKDIMQSNFTRSFSDEQLQALFERVDVDNSGSIDFDEFSSFIMQMEEETKKHNIYTQEELDHSTNSVSKLGIMTGMEKKDAVETDTNMVIKNPENWRLMYCGGPHVMKVLKKVSSTHNVALSLESFSW